MSWTVYLGSALGLVVAALYGHLGVVHARRARVTGLPAAAFATFWLCIAGHAALESAYAIAVALGLPSLDVGVTVLVLKIATGVFGIGGLVLYLLLVYGLSRRVVPLLTLAYATIFAVMLYDYLARVPVDQELRTWYAGLRYLHPEGALHQAVAVLLFLPPLLATIAYLMLLRVSREAPQRRRILATGSGFIVFFGAFLLGWVHERWFWWGLLERLLALGSSLAILWTLDEARHGALLREGEHVADG